MTNKRCCWLFERAEERRQRAVKEAEPAFLSKCAADPSPPSWFRLLEFNSMRYWDWYVQRGLCGFFIDPEPAAQGSTSLSWTEQDVAEPDTLKVRGKALGRLIVDFEGDPSRIWVALPCPLGQEFETSDEYQRPVRAPDQGCPDKRHATADGACLDNTQTDGERNDLFEQRMALKQSKTGIYNDASHDKVVFWRWQFPPCARDGDIIAVLVGTCALLRPSHGRYEFIEPGLRVPVVSSPAERLDDTPEWNFLKNHREDLDTFVLI